MSKILVIGGSGFLGNPFIKKLNELPEKTVWAPSHKDLELADPSSVSQAISKFEPDVIYIIAGKMRGSASDIYNTNTLGTINVIKSVKDLKSQAKIIGVGSAAEYGLRECNDGGMLESELCSPTSHYGISKLGATVALQEASRDGLWTSIVRPFNIIGQGIPDTLVVGGIIARVKAVVSQTGEKIIKTGRTDTERDFVHVEDVADGLIAVASTEKSGEIYNFCSGVATPIKTVVDTILAKAGEGISTEIDPAFYRPNEIITSFGSCEKAKREGIFNPSRPLHQAIEEAWNVKG